MSYELPMFGVVGRYQLPESPSEYVPSLLKDTCAVTVGDGAEDDALTDSDGTTPPVDR
jgi:hypothetical protein